MTEGKTLRPMAERCRGTVRPLLNSLLVAGLLATAGPLPAALAEDVPAQDETESLFDVIRSLPDRLVPKAQNEDPRSADALFAAAMTELQGARFDEARRLLELFVVRDPQHPSVPEARRHLSELYQIDTKAVPHGEPAETAAMPDAVQATAQPEAPAVVPARVVTTPRAVGGKLESGFMLEAGDRVFFAPRSAELGTRARSVLAAQARWLKRNASLSAVIEGHADDPALDANGMDRLSAERAEAVFRRLLEEGVAPERLAISPQGKTRPVAVCASADCAAQNRRAVTVLTAQRVSELPGADMFIGPRQP